MKMVVRALQLSAALALVGLASASAAQIPTCTYTCRNTTTGAVTFRSAPASRQTCCSGQGLSCPAGSTFDGPIAWNNQFIETC